MYYSRGYAANVMKTISQLHGELLSVEKVFRSGGRYMMWDILDRYNLGSQGLSENHCEIQYQVLR
jgi:hypothetical protein